jgi:hypothetical protein
VFEEIFQSDKLSSPPFQPTVVEIKRSSLQLVNVKIVFFSSIISIYYLYAYSHHRIKFPAYVFLVDRTLVPEFIHRYNQLNQQFLYISS